MMRTGELLSTEDVALLLDLIHASLSCSSEDELSGLITDMNYIIPFEFAICGYGTNNRRNRDIYRLINVSYPQQWIEHYVSTGLDQRDPIVRENSVNYAVQYWADTFKKYDDSQPFIIKAADFGLRSGYAYGLKNPNGDKASLFSFAGRSMKRDPRTELILEHLIPHLHQAFSRVVRNRNTAQSQIGELSPREREVLKWASDGKSTWEISMILSISKDTVKFHLKNIMQKLQVVSRAQAVAVALENGVIGIE
jgi:LuxR family transcriptional regulator, quorum-sensing system regulator CviR